MIIYIPDNPLTKQCVSCGKIISAKSSFDDQCMKCHGIKRNWDHPIWECEKCGNKFTKFEIKHGLCHNCMEGTYLEARRKARTEFQNRAIDYAEYLEACKLKGIYDILHMHHDLLGKDPEHLSTEFILSLVKVKPKIKEIPNLTLAIPTDPIQSEVVEIKTNDSTKFKINRIDLEATLPYTWSDNWRNPKYPRRITTSMKINGRKNIIRIQRFIVSRMIGRDLQTNEVITNIDGNILNNVRENLAFKYQ